MHDGSMGHHSYGLFVFLVAHTTAAVLAMLLLASYPKPYCGTLQVENQKALSLLKRFVQNGREADGTLTRDR